MVPVSSAETARTAAHLRHLRWVWLGVGWLSLVLGLVGVFVPLLPTAPFVLLAAACFSRGSARWDHWLLSHPRFGPLVRDWRACRAVPLRGKVLASVGMVVSSAWAWWAMPVVRWLPAVLCALVAAWLWSLPSGAPAASDGSR